MTARRAQSHAGKQEGAGTGGPSETPRGAFWPSPLTPLHCSRGIENGRCGAFFFFLIQLFIGPNSYQMALCGNRVLKSRFLLKQRNNRV